MASRAKNGALAHLIGEGGDFLPFRLDRRHDVFAVEPHRRAGEIAQGHVPRRAPVGVLTLRR